MTWAVWITGLPGSGKSAIVRAAAAALAVRGESVEILELDVLRRVLTPVPRYDAAERDAVYRALVAIARSLTRADRAVLIDATGHRRGWRKLARACIANFAEVQLVCRVDVARERERTRAAGHHPLGIYAKAGYPGATVPGVDVAYEDATFAELVIDTTWESVQSAGLRVAVLSRSLGRAFAPPVQSRGWALWISGPPGSGKTTLASNVDARLNARGVKTAVVNVTDVTTLITADGVPSPLQREIAMRAIVVAAKLLVEAGLAVIIDGPAPVRDAGELARQHLERFAQVELACPAELRRMRERAARWALMPCPTACRSAALPDLGLDYEATRHPDLVLYTDVLDRQTAVEEVLRLIAAVERAVCDRRVANLATRGSRAARAGVWRPARAQVSNTWT
jgi:adenylylsulfate kinase